MNKSTEEAVTQKISDSQSGICVLSTITISSLPGLQVSLTFNQFVDPLMFLIGQFVTSNHNIYYFPSPNFILHSLQDHVLCNYQGMRTL